MENKAIGPRTKIAVGFAGEDTIKAFMHEMESIENKQFDQYIIAYIDFLGMKEKMKQENSFESLQIMRFLINNVKRNASFISKINSLQEFEIKIFSDNIVIAQKVDNEMLRDQIVSLINLVSLIQFEAFFQFDFPLRGGITIGELYIDNSVVWGTGLIEAYRIESSLAVYPRVIVSNGVLNRYENCKQESLNLYAFIKKDTDGFWFVNYFLAAPNIQLIPEISASLQDKAKSHVNEDDRTRQKINWIISFFNSYCNEFKNRGDYAKYVLPNI